MTMHLIPNELDESRSAILTLYAGGNLEEVHEIVITQGTRAEILILPAEDDSKRPPSHNDDKEAVGYVSVMGQEIESRVLFSLKAGVQ